MTVKELIDELQAVEDDALPVVIDYHDYLDDKNKEGNVRGIDEESCNGRRYVRLNYG